MLQPKQLSTCCSGATARPFLKLTNLSSIGETGSVTGGPLLDLDAFRAAFSAWLDEHDDLVTRQRQCFSLELLDVATVQQEFQEALFTGGWVRYGWPEELGGLGGDARHRAAHVRRAGQRGVCRSRSRTTRRDADPDVRACTRPISRAHISTDLAARRRAWCQGFSEPDAGSDLASLRTKAVRDGDDWVSTATRSGRRRRRCRSGVSCSLRTGTPESRHRGLSMMLVDHDTPGVEVRPIRAMSGRDEFGEVLFDDVRVGGDRLIGNEGDGWAMAMYLLQWERGMYPWQRQAGLLGTSRRAARTTTATASIRGELADAYLSVLPMRVSAAQHDPAAGGGGDARVPRSRSTRCCSPGPRSRCYDLVDTVLDARDRAGRRSRTRRVGATTTCSAGRRRSTAVPSRSSGRSWPTACWGCRVAEDDRHRPGHARHLRAHGARRAGAARATTAPPRSRRSAGATSSPPTRRRWCRSCSGCSASSCSRAPRSTTSRSPRSAPSARSCTPTGHAFAHPLGFAPAATSTATGYTVDALVFGGRRDAAARAGCRRRRVVTVAGAALELDPVVGMDPALGLVRVRGAVVAGDVAVHEATRRRCGGTRLPARRSRTSSSARPTPCSRRPRSTRRCASSSVSPSARSRR